MIDVSLSSRPVLCFGCVSSRTSSEDLEKKTVYQLLFTTSRHTPRTLIDWRELLLVQKAMLLVIYSHLPQQVKHLAN